MFPPERVMVSVADCGATVLKLRPLAWVPANVRHFRQVTLDRCSPEEKARRDATFERLLQDALVQVLTGN